MKRILWLFAFFALAAPVSAQQCSWVTEAPEVENASEPDIFRLTGSVICAPHFTYYYYETQWRSGVWRYGCADWSPQHGPPGTSANCTGTRYFGCPDGYAGFLGYRGRVVNQTITQSPSYLWRDCGEGGGGMS